VGVATLFTLVNAFSAGYYMSDSGHALLHGALTVAGVYWVWWLAVRAWRQQRPPALPAGEDRLERLQLSMDAVAVEVERIGEAARFVSKLEAEQKDKAR
jgi:hypothetical protein